MNNMIPGFTAKETLKGFSISEREFVTARIRKYVESPHTLNIHMQAVTPQFYFIWGRHGRPCIPGCICYTGENCPCCNWNEIFAPW